MVVEPGEHEGRRGDGEGGGRAVAFPQEARAPEFRLVYILVIQLIHLSPTFFYSCTMSVRCSLF